ncbi:MAG: biotin carboxylase, partial [Rubrivivax sp.]|nr:biotin carboxylase [Rubrivivax sp.]
NEIFATSFTAKLREKAKTYTHLFGEQLRKEGYRGYFELDFLIDQKSREIYLGELNPRITGASSMTNHAAFAHADAPLFLFHLLEFSGAKFDIDIDELNARWAEKDNIDSWCQMVIKHTDDTVDLITDAPATGIWKLNNDGTAEYDRFDYHRRAVTNEREAFFLRIMKPGDYRYEGADLGILVTRGRAMDDNFRMQPRTRQWIKAIRAHYRAKPLTAPAPVEAMEHSFKIM